MATPDIDVIFVYEFVEVKVQLSGWHFEGDSDSEVTAAAMMAFREQFGVDIAGRGWQSVRIDRNIETTG